jgi:hypothetical protein
MIVEWQQDLTFAVRQFRRSPGFAATAVLTLALGIGATTAILSLIEGILLRALPFPHADQMGAPLTVTIGGFASVMGAWWFSVQLPKIRVEARQLIVAQAMAGGRPAEEMSAPVAEE